MSKAALLPKVFLRIWSVYLLLVPFYLMGKTPIPGTEKVEGGVPQLADYYLTVVMILVFSALPFRLNRWTVCVVGSMLGFVFYTGLVNGAWAVSLEDSALLKSTVYYAYDGLLLLTCLVLYANFQEQFLYVTVQALTASVVLQAILSPLAIQPTHSRQELFFNNENQLGYFCLLAATIFVLGARRFSIRLRYQLIFYAAVAYLALLAQSRGALMGLTALAIVAQLGRPLRLLFGLGAVLGLYLLLTMTPSFLPKSAERLVVQGEYDTLATRGYDRIVNYPEYILFGAGEGAYERFRSELYASEIHSSYGTLLFCYGIPGTALFTLGLLCICRPDPRMALYLIPALVHSFSHHGARFASFWTLLAFVCGMAMDREQQASLLEPPAISPAVTPGSANGAPHDDPPP